MLSKITCRQCGGEIDLFDLGPKKICPHCNKEALPVNIKEVHAHFANTIYGDPYELPREGQQRFLAAIDYINVYFHLELSMGDISSPPRSNAFVYTHSYSSYKSMERFVKKQIEKLSQAEDDATAYLWIHERDVNAYLNLLKFSHLFKRFREVYLIRCHSKEDMQNDEYQPNDSFAKRTRVTRDDLDAMTAKYDEIVQHGGAYRVGCYGDVRVCSEEYLESFVMRQITNKYLNFNSIYLKVQEAFEKETGYIIDYHMVEELVWHLMISKQVKSRGACMWWGDSSYNNMLCTQCFCLDTPKSVSYTYDDALGIICDAFEWGYTYPLYDIIADDAVLKFEDSKSVFRGKQRIIKFIENDGSHRVNARKGKATCVIARVKKGKRYGIGERCIILHYSYGNRGRLFIVRVHFENNQIVKIQMFNPMGPMEFVEDGE